LSLQEETFVEGNYKAIFAEIARIPLERADIKLGERVVEVSSVERELKEGQVVLKTEKGESFSFDEVLMTTPLGFLKRNKHIFKPSLPPRLLAGIDAVSVGHLEKVSKKNKTISKAKEKTRSTSHFLKHSGSIHLLDQTIQVLHQNSKHLQRTLFQALPTGSHQTILSKPTPNAGPKKSGTSPPSHPRTDTRQFSSISTASAPSTSSILSTESPTKNATISLTSFTDPTTHSSLISQPRIQHVSRKLFYQVRCRKMNYLGMVVIPTFKSGLRMQMVMCKL